MALGPRLSAPLLSPRTCRSRPQERLLGRIMAGQAAHPGALKAVWS